MMPSILVVDKLLELNGSSLLKLDLDFCRDGKHLLLHTTWDGQRRAEDDAST